MNWTLYDVVLILQEYMRYQAEVQYQRLGFKDEGDHLKK